VGEGEGKTLETTVDLETREGGHSKIQLAGRGGRQVLFEDDGKARQALEERKGKGSNGRD